MRGILSGSSYLPHYRLDRSHIAAFLGAGGGRGKRAVASFDEDTTTMGFEAGRRCLRATTVLPDAILFAVDRERAATQLVSEAVARGFVRSTSPDGEYILWLPEPNPKPQSPP